MIKELTIEKKGLPVGWEMKTLGEVCSFQNGFAFKSKTYKDDGIPVVRITNIQDESIDLSKIVYIDPKDYNKDLSKYKIIKGDLLIAMSGATTGKIGIHNTEEELLLNQRVGKFEPSENLNKTYLLNFLKTKVEESLAISAGAAQPNLSTEQIKNFQIPLPPLNQQKQIVAILDKAFAAIDTAKANAEQNLQNAKELFESYLQNVFENKGNDWEEKTLGVVCNKIQDGAHHSPKTLYPNREEGLYPYVTSKNVRNNYMDLTKLQFVDEAFHKTIYPRCKPEIGDVLLTKDGAKTGNVTLNTLDEPFSLLSSVCLIKTNKNELRADFLKYYIQSPIGFKSITGKMTGAAIKRIILRAIKSATIPLPLVDEQKEIVKNIDSLLTETKKLEAIYTQKIADLEEMKKSVLQKAFSGQLNIIN